MQPTVAVDFDGTIIELHPHSNLDTAKLRDGAKEGIEEFWDAGWKVIIWTAHEDPDSVGDWLDDQGIPYHEINNNSDVENGARKIVADIYIDDRAVSALKPWHELVKTAKERMEHFNKVKHIIITGHSGAGKSTMAKRLSEKTGLPVHKVDQDPMWKENEDITDDPDRYTWGTRASVKYKKLLKKLVRRALAKETPHILEGCQFLVAPGTLRGHHVVILDGDEDTIIKQRLKRDEGSGKLTTQGHDVRTDKARYLYRRLKPAVDAMKGFHGVETITPADMDGWIDNYQIDRGPQQLTDNTNAGLDEKELETYGEKRVRRTYGATQSAYAGMFPGKARNYLSPKVGHQRGLEGKMGTRGPMVPKEMFPRKERKAYEKVPNNLMGFNRHGQGQEYASSRYPHSQPVRVSWDGDTHDDEVRGLNREHALERARRNWEGAKVEPRDEKAYEVNQISGDRPFEDNEGVARGYREQNDDHARRMVTPAKWERNVEMDSIRHRYRRPERKSMDYKEFELERAQIVDLITLPEDVKGTNCSNCKWIKDGFCINPAVQQEVNERMCCALWDNVGVKRKWEDKKTLSSLDTNTGGALVQTSLGPKIPKRTSHAGDQLLPPEKRKIVQPPDFSEHLIHENEGGYGPSVRPTSKYGGLFTRTKTFKHSNINLPKLHRNVVRREIHREESGLHGTAHRAPPEQRAELKQGLARVYGGGSHRAHKMKLETFHPGQREYHARWQYVKRIPFFGQKSGLHDAAVTLGHAGGKRGGPARARVLSAAERSKIARMGGLAKPRS